jgi:site-specific recombinase XerC
MSGGNVSSLGEVKTEYSRDSVPLDPALVEALMQHQKRSISTPEGWPFANPATRKPYHQEEIQKRHIRNPGIAANIGSDIGWHKFRHSYRSWLDETGAPHRPKGVDAPRQYSNHNERLRQGNDRH